MFISCATWIKRGVSKSKPDKIKITPDLIGKMSRPEGMDESSSDDENGHIVDQINEFVDDSFAQEGKLQEDTISNNESDTEDEDEIIKDSDNLIVVGNVGKDKDALTIYVYNESENDFYIHHDILLMNSPLSIEWLNHTNQSESANFVAIGGMGPVIEVWNVDVINPLQPEYTLGYKAPKKKFAHRNHGHKDSVLDLSWNPHLPHILASSSVDKTVLLWDLDRGNLSTTLDNFSNNIETIEWHITEGETLLAGDGDGLVKIFDCRYKDTFKEWRVNGEAFVAKWNICNPYQMLVGTSTGYTYIFDSRAESPLWISDTQLGEITGLSMSSYFPGMLVTCHVQGVLNISDIKTNPTNITTINTSIGHIHAFALNPDSAYIGCVGGSKKNKNLCLIDFKTDNEVIEHWGGLSIDPTSS